MSIIEIEIEIEKVLSKFVYVENDNSELIPNSATYNKFTNVSIETLESGMLYVTTLEKDTWVYYACVAVI